MTSYVWPENLDHRLVLVDGVSQIEAAIARIRDTLEAMGGEKTEPWKAMMCGVICAEVAVRQMLRVLTGEEGERAG